MNEIKFDYSIRSDLRAGPENPASLGTKFVATLDALSRIDPTIFKDWQVLDRPARDSLPLAQARPRIEAIVERNVTRDDFGRPDRYYGYSAVAFTSDALKSHKTSLRIKAGGKSKGDTWLRTGDWKVLPDPAIVTYPLFKATLLAINAVWPPLWSFADAFRMDYERVPVVPGAALFPYSRFHIPWIGYLSAPLTAGLDLPSEISTERTPDGGLLMIATTEQLDPETPEHLRRARIIAETMIARTGYSQEKARDQS